jgi:hypothetical protein
MPISHDLGRRLTSSRFVEYDVIAEQKAVIGFSQREVPHKPGQIKLKLPLVSTFI